MQLLQTVRHSHSLHSDKDIDTSDDDSDGVIKHRHNARKHFVQDGISNK